MFNIVLAISFAMVPPATAQKQVAAEKYAAYLVVPNDFTKMGTANRQRLGINGSFGRAQFGAKQESGFHAWLTVQQAAKLRTAADVSAVKPMLAAQVDNKFSPKAHNAVVVRLLPNSWNKKPALKGSYESTEQVIVKWQKAFGKRVTKIVKGKATGTIRIEFNTKFDIKAERSMIEQRARNLTKEQIKTQIGESLRRYGSSLPNGETITQFAERIFNLREAIHYENVFTTVKKHRQVGELSGATVEKLITPKVLTEPYPLKGILQPLRVIKQPGKPMDIPLPVDPAIMKKLKEWEESKK